MPFRATGDAPVLEAERREGKAQTTAFVMFSVGKTGQGKENILGLVE